ncbi:GNAT family N-acetyltransferase [Methylobacterium currus]|uniref:GNAT family N-acetyltransferase n=1 Tax=Methylobacterium currus TaxID=2051553 RepID=UPI001E5C9F8E|nr:GNAT family N-acetyltransferase [Methylobacterium currus]UHC17253.1 GNAT family N-acetyltransferase [Methylobacterium currus]
MTNPAEITQTDAAPRIRPMTEADLAALHGLSVEVRWPHRAEDWRLMLAVGQGLVACDEAGRVTGSAMWWPFGDGLATIGMVIVSPRQQARGTGRRLMRELFSAAGPRTIRLTATEAGRRLYESEGFRVTGTNTQYQGIADAAATVDDKRVRPVVEADWPAIAALDREASGGDRSRMLDALRRAGRIVVLEEHGRIAGYSVCRPFGRGHILGPVVAADAGSAVALASPHVRAQAGAFLRLDTPERDGPLVAFAQACGLAQVDLSVTMTRGQPPATGPARIFTLANQALG